MDESLVLTVRWTLESHGDGVWLSQDNSLLGCPEVGGRRNLTLAHCTSIAAADRLTGRHVGAPGAWTIDKGRDKGRDKR